MWKILGGISLVLVVTSFALRVPMPFWTLALLGMNIVIAGRAVLRDLGSSARANEVNADIYGRDERGRAKKATYHEY